MGVNKLGIASQIENGTLGLAVGAEKQAMAEKHLVAAISRRFKNMSARDRLAKIRKLASKSPADEKFIQRTFPDLYREAFPPSSEGARSESTPPQTLYAKRN
jgi:hypothetical protein